MVGCRVEGVEFFGDEVSLEVVLPLAGVLVGDDDRGGGLSG